MQRHQLGVQLLQVWIPCGCAFGVARRCRRPSFRSPATLAVLRFIFDQARCSYIIYSGVPISHNCRRHSHRYNIILLGIARDAPSTTRTTAERTLSKIQAVSCHLSKPGCVRWYWRAPVASSRNEPLISAPLLRILCCQGMTWLAVARLPRCRPVGR